MAGGAQAERLGAKAWIIIILNTHMNSHSQNNLHLIRKEATHFVVKQKGF